MQCATYCIYYEQTKLSVNQGMYLKKLRSLDMFRIWNYNTTLHSDKKVVKSEGVKQKV